VFQIDLANALFLGAKEPPARNLAPTQHQARAKCKGDIFLMI